MNDQLKIEVLADGTVKTTTDSISPANHRQAEEFMRLLATLTGGETTRGRNTRGQQHGHRHQEGEEHAHA